MTVATGKRAFYAQIEMELSDAYKYTSKTMTDNLLKNDAKEGINAFLEKRSPDWKDEYYIKLFQAKEDQLSLR